MAVRKSLRIVSVCVAAGALIVWATFIYAAQTYSAGRHWWTPLFTVWTVFVVILAVFAIVAWFAPLPAGEKKPPPAKRPAPPAWQQPPWSAIPAPGYLGRLRPEDTAKLYTSDTAVGVARLQVSASGGGGETSAASVQTVVEESESAPDAERDTVSDGLDLVTEAEQAGFDRGYLKGEIEGFTRGLMSDLEPDPLGDPDGEPDVGEEPPADR